MIHPDELATVAAGVPEKAWHEATCWAYIAWRREGMEAK